VVHEVDVGGQVEGAEAAAEGEAGALGPILWNRFDRNLRIRNLTYCLKFKFVNMILLDLISLFLLPKP
jgi:hypothetical protein